MGALLHWILLLFVFNVIKVTLCSTNHQEIHEIMKRMAEHGEEFEGYDVARVMLLKGSDQKKRRLFKRDLQNVVEDKSVKNVQLHLKSGPKIDLDLRSSGITDSTTQVSHLTRQKRLVRKLRGANCYSYGKIKDSSGDGWAAFSHCDGLFGFAGSSGYEYFIRPVEVKRSKRETNEGYDIHVMWRRSRLYSYLRDYVSNIFDRNTFLSYFFNDFIYMDDNDSSFVTESNNVTITPGKVIIELAMFSDAQYWQRLQNLYPGREDDFLLTRLSATQALYSNQDKVGYEVQIKVKLLEYWVVNPVNYTFGDTLGANLRSFCSYVREKYSYDIHGLNTGLQDQEGGTVGLAYVNGACSRQPCFVSLPVRINQFVVYAHELGHNLGLTHFSTCPANLSSIGGFMGGGASLNFSPCMKHQFKVFLQRRSSGCLFVESFPSRLEDLTDVLPGQSQSPDELCHILAGPGYTYMPFGDLEEKGICQWWVCICNDDTHPDFGRVRRFPVPYGFPCKEEAFCLSRGNCQAWSDTTMALEINKLRSYVQIPHWSSWTAGYSFCSRSCGTGVQIRTRHCQYPGRYNLSPHCKGPWFKGRLCNRNPCPNDPTSVSDLRQVRGDEVCSRFLADNVRLNLKDARGYRATSSEVTVRDVGSVLQRAHSRSCMVKCDRDPVIAVGDLDGFMPDGTPCFEGERPTNDLENLGIERRCVRGFCTEFSDCPEETQVKDKCGVCGGDGSRCMELTFGRDYDVARRRRSQLMVIPVGSENIQVSLSRRLNRGVVIELWDLRENNIIGRRGDARYSNDYYSTDNPVPFAGTNWSYSRFSAYLRARGPTNEGVIIKAYRARGEIRSIKITFAAPPAT